MTKPDDKHDHELAAWLDGSDGVSAAYRQTAHEEPPPALDRAILQAAREAVQPRAASRHAAQPDVRARHNLARKPYALAASVMIAIAGLSFYIGVRDDVALQPGAAVERVIQLEAPAPPQQGAVPVQNPAPVQEAEAAAETRLRQAEAERVRSSVAEAAAERAAASNFEQRQLAPPAPVIDGPFVERIEAEAARAQGEEPQFQEIMVTGSRIAQPGNPPAYRASREEWLDAMRALVADIERSSRLAVARRNTAVLEERLEEEVELFLQSYPDTDIDAELGL